MIVKIPEALYKHDESAFKPFGGNADSLGWQSYVELNLDGMAPAKLKALLALVEPHTHLRGVTVLLRDIKRWLAVAAGEQGVKPRTLRQFEPMVRKLLQDTEGHRVYKRDDQRDAWLCYYVNETAYRPRYETGSSVTPEHVNIELVWEEFGKRRRTLADFYEEDYAGMTVPEALAKSGLFAETPALRAAYLVDVARWRELVGKVGLQCLGVGSGTQDLDGNSSRYGATVVRLDVTGPARVVVDVYHEGEEERDRDSRISLRTSFWKDTSGAVDPQDNLTDDDETDDDKGKRGYSKRRSGVEPADVRELPSIEVPIHPMVACFDLRRHLRLRVHVACLTEYAYDKTLSDRLVLPPDTRSMVSMLVSGTSVFKDIIEGKGNGAVILCTGIPGVGKTMSAEVYAEVMARPLYSVQCSQLGTDPNGLEKQLLRVFARAQRWRAILLLDEADVYVTARGSDLQQNAIVGVFLRVLEYYAGVLFMTTNRADLVDDAIASRCLARIDYKAPTIGDQVKIWRVLADTAGVEIHARVIIEIAKAYPGLSGRDVKNLLKLSSMLVASGYAPAITLDVVRFAKRFKPTVDYPDRGES